MYMHKSSGNYQCTCPPGPGASCSACRSAEESVSDLLSNYEPVNDYNLFSSDYETQATYVENKTKHLKFRWLESTTEKAVLVVDKKDRWYWIPLSVITHIDKTSKGNLKIEVPDFYKAKEATVVNHRYFNRDEYK